MSRRAFTLPAVAVALVFVAGTASAHPGHDATGFAGGFAHPFGGLDHLLAMVAVGLWAGQLGGRMVWALPAAFVMTMIAGSAAGFAAVGLPGLEIGIGGSVIALGALTAFHARPAATLALATTAGFAVFHGYAHGAEAASGAAGYVAGFVGATALLHAAGVAAGYVLCRIPHRAAMRLAGGGIALAGLAMVVG